MWTAQFAILLTQFWLGYPYMFLVCLGALQSIPHDMTEAAAVDGARPYQAFRAVVFPLLLIAVAPLLISSFAYNFNNFNVDPVDDRRRTVPARQPEGRRAPTSSSAMSTGSPSPKAARNTASPQRCRC